MWGAWMDKYDEVIGNARLEREAEEMAKKAKRKEYEDDIWRIAHPILSKIFRR